MMFPFITSHSSPSSALVQKESYTAAKGDDTDPNPYN